MNKGIQNQKVLILLLFVITIAARVPGLLILGERYYEDPGDDGAIYIDAGQNIRDGHGFTNDFIKYFTPRTGSRGNSEIRHPIFVVPPAYPLFLAAIFLIRDSLLAAVLGNTFLSGLTVIVLYLLFQKAMGKTVALISAGLVAFNPMMYAYSTNILSEMLYVLMCTLTFYFLVATDRYPQRAYYYMVLAGVLGGLCFLSRYIGIFVVVSGGLWLLLNRRYKQGILFGAVALVVITSWFFIRSSLLTGDPLIYFHLTGLYPPAISHNGAGAIPLVQRMFSRVWYGTRALLNLAHDLSSPAYFFCLLPFIIIGCVLYSRDRRFSLFIVFLVVMVLGLTFVLRHSIERYYIGIIPFLVPIGLAAMRDCLKHIPLQKAMGIRINSTGMFVGLVTIMLLVSWGTIFRNVRAIRSQAQRAPHYASMYRWLKESADPDSKVGSTDPPRCHYFTSLQAVMLPVNVDERWMEHYINHYGLSYIVLDSERKSRYSKNRYISSVLYSGDSVVPIGDFQLVLARVSKDRHYTVWLYLVEGESL